MRESWPQNHHCPSQEPSQPWDFGERSLTKLKSPMMSDREVCRGDPFLPVPFHHSGQHPGRNSWVRCESIPSVMGGSRLSGHRLEPLLEGLNLKESKLESPRPGKRLKLPKNPKTQGPAWMESPMPIQPPG